MRLMTSQISKVCRLVCRLVVGGWWLVVGGGGLQVVIGRGWWLVVGLRATGCGRTLGGSLDTW